MNAFTALILGLVEGLTEFLPVSSTGHLILASNALGLENSEFLKLFEIVIQTGAILAVIYIYWKEIMQDKAYIIKLGVAFIPTAVLGLLVHDLVKQHLFSPLVVCVSLFVGGVVLLFLENLTSGIPEKKFGYKQYFFVGMFQCLAFIPGVSRSAATILGARLLGGSREESVKFSFLLAIPTILAASAYSLLKVKHVITADEYSYLGIGMLSAFVFGFLSVKVFLKLLNHRTFIVCGVYRIVFALIYYFFFI